MKRVVKLFHNLKMNNYFIYVNPTVWLVNKSDFRVRAQGIQVTRKAHAGDVMASARVSWANPVFYSLRLLVTVTVHVTARGLGPGWALGPAGPGNGSSVELYPLRPLDM